MRGLFVALGVLLAAAAPASAFEAGTTALLDRPTGLADLPAAGLTGTIPLVGAMTPNGRYVAFVSGDDGLSTTDDNRLFGLWVRDRMLQTTTLVHAPVGSSRFSDPVDISDDGDRVCFSTSVSLDSRDNDTAPDVYVKDMSDGTAIWASRRANEANSSEAAGGCAISGNGLHVAFVSDGPLDDADDNGTKDVYRNTLADGSTSLISRESSLAGAVGNSASIQPAINENGHVIAFSTFATNFVAADNNGQYDIAVRRVLTSETLMASTVHGSSTTVANDISTVPSISADGDYVAFVSRANDLDPGAGDSGDVLDIYRKRLSTNEAILVSRATGTAGAKANAESDWPAISSDGTAVAFSSSATNLDAVADGLGADEDAYVRRGIGGGSPTTELASRDDGATGVAGDGASEPYAISTNGDKVLFETVARNLSNDGAEDFVQFFVRDGTTTEPVSRPSGPPGAFASPQAAADLNGFGRKISDDGRYVVFTSGADGLSTEDDNGLVNAFVRDNQTHETVLVSRASGSAGAAANASVGEVTISGDGRRVALLTRALNVGGSPAGSGFDRAFVRDLETHTTTIASLTDAEDELDGAVNRMSLDRDGSHLAFTTNATNAANGDNDATPDVHVRDLTAGTTLLASIAGDGTKGNGPSTEPSLSADGTRVSFTSTAPNMVDGDLDFFSDVLMRDLAAQTTTLISGPGVGGAVVDQASLRSSISGDGTRVAFASMATNLIAADTDFLQDILVRDLTAGTTVLASRATGAAGTKSDSQSEGAEFSADGTAVVFTSFATTLDPDDADATLDADVYVRRLDTNATVLASRGATGGRYGMTATDGHINGDGSCIVFEGSTGPTDPLPPASASPDFRHILLRTLRSTCPLPDPPPVGGGGGNGGSGGSGGTSGAPTIAPPPSTTPAQRPAAPDVRRPPRLVPSRTFTLPRACTSRRRLRIRFAVPAGARTQSVAVTINGKRARSTRRGTNVDLTGLPRGRFTVKVTLRLADGRTATTTRTYRTCAPRRRGR